MNQFTANVHRARIACGVVFALAALVGCQTVPPTPDNDPDGPGRVDLLNTQMSFETTGRLSLTTPVSTDQARFSLQADGDDLSLQISGPFGIGAVRLEVEDGQGRLISARHGDIELENTREDLAALLGYPVPLDAIRYWALGLEAPETPAQRTMGPDGRLLAMLVQDGWQVEYLDYQSASLRRGEDQFEVELPRKVRLMGPEIQILMVFRNWRF